MQRMDDVTEHGVSFDSTDLIFDENQAFFSEIEGFPEFNSNSDFSNQSLTMEDLKIPFDTNEWGYNEFQNQGQWDQNYPSDSYGNFSNTNMQQFPGEMSANQINSFQNSQEYQDFSTNQNPSFQPQGYASDQMQFLQVPQTFDNKPQTSITPSPNSDYFSGNTSSDSSPPRSSNRSTSSPFSDNPNVESGKQQNRNQQTNPPRHNLGNLPNGLMKALTTVLTQTNNPAFKQLIKSQETTTTTTPKSKTTKRKITKIASKPEPKKAPLIIPIQKSGLTNKPSLEEVRKKKAERMIRNREAALQSRRRKLDEQAALEDTCRDLQDRNVQLEKQVSFLEGRLSQIEETNRKLELQLAKFTRPKVLASVAFLMFISFVAFCTWPTAPMAISPSQSLNVNNNNNMNNIPNTLNELQWLLRPADEIWKSLNSFYYGEEKYELAVARGSPPVIKTNNNKDILVDYNSLSYGDNRHQKSRIIADRTMDYTYPENLIISLPQQDWPAGLNSTQVHSDFIHFLRNQSVSKELTLAPVPRGGGKNRPMLLRFPPSDNPLYLKYLNETSFIFDSLQPEFQQRPENLFVVSLDHAFWIPSRSTPNQTLSLIFPNQRDYETPNYFSWTRWDCVVTGYQEFLTPLPV